MSLLDEVLSRLPQPKKDGAWFTSYCPAHESAGNGHHPSLRLKEADQVDDGVIVSCMAGCARDDLQAALGLSETRAKTSKTDDNTHLFYVAKKKTGKTIVATYDYTDEDGELLFQKVRFEPKEFVQRRPLNGHWAWGLSAGELAQDDSGDWRKVQDWTPASAPRKEVKAVRQVLYRLPEVITSERVVIAEGEKGADALRSIGLTATCASSGAGKWRAEYAKSLDGKRVVVCPDNDEQGRKHGEVVISALRRADIECCTLRLPGLPEKGDPYDAVKAGLTIEEFEELAAAAFMRREDVETREILKEKRAEHRLTEGGNAERYVAQHKDRIAFVPERGLLAYRDGIFSKDDTTLMRYAKETVAAMYAESGVLDEADSRRALAAHAARSDTQRAMSAMVSLSAHDPDIEVPITEFDSDPYFICAKNGVVDLKTGELHEHSPKQRMLKRTGASYQPHAVCPTWMSHLHRIFAGDQELIAFLQVLFGYALTGLSVEQVFAIFHGGGANGKSVTLHLMEQALGDYACSADASTFSRHRSDAIRNDLARLNGARLVTTFERAARQTLDEETVKRLTGGDKITARFLHKEAFEYTPQFLIIMSTNHKPTVDSADYAIKRRVMLVPFNVTIPDAEQDKFLEEKLREELDGILTWGIIGATMYCQGGLQIPESVSAATDAYREEMDPLSGFTELLFPDQGSWVSNVDVRGALERWAKEEGIKDLPAGKTFAAWMTAHGAVSERRHNGRGWRGIRVEGCHAEQSLGMGDGLD